MAKRGVTVGQSSMAKCMITPPSLNRQHSYSTRQTWSHRSSDATTALANVALRTASPNGRKSLSNSPLSTPAEMPESGRRTSWDDCRLQRDGYISFPDFDQLSAENETRSNT